MIIVDSRIMFLTFVCSCEFVTWEQACGGSTIIFTCYSMKIIMAKHIGKNGQFRQEKAITRHTVKKKEVYIGSKFVFNHHGVATYSV